jgi:hypothetical protein
MRESRNPFRLRRAESIDTDSDFLNLFEPGILEVLSEGGLPETVRPVRSAAGGGKTSLLRLFTPNVLLKLHSRRGEDRVKELYRSVQALKAVDEAGPKILGVLLLCGRNYAVLQDVPLDQHLRDRLFFGLLNARIVLAVLRSALALKGLEYPKDLAQVSVSPSAGSEPPPDMRVPCGGIEMYEWARGVEKRICAALDNFGPLRPEGLPGYDSLFALSLIRPEAVTVGGQLVADRVVLMMDDIHMLTPQQRSTLIERVVEARSRVGVLIAERFEALTTQEMLASGSAVGRDHEPPIELERYWRKYHQRFEKHVMRLAEKRVRASSETEMGSFSSCLESNLDGPDYEVTFRRAACEVAARVRERVRGETRFQEWLDVRERGDGSPRERAVAWRALEILIERDLRRPQKGLFDDTALAEDDLEAKDDSKLNQAAELFLAREYDLPYYYGPDRIARIASLNIEQFLGIAGTMFEEAISAELIRGLPGVLPARRQHDILKHAARMMWDDIPNRVRHGRALRQFLESVGRFCQWKTYQATAPNDFGVAGTGILMPERTDLIDSTFLRRNADHKRLADLVASALAHNFLIADLDYGNRGNRMMVLNLNRLLCVHFDLPLNYGLYKERPLRELVRWIDHPFSPPQQTEELFV